VSTTDLDELARAREATGWPEDEQHPDAGSNGGSESVAERAENGEEPQEELFPLGSVSGDPKRTYKNLIPAGTPTKTQAKLSNTAVPMTDGLYAYGQRGEILVTFEAGTVKQVPELGDEKSDGTRRLDGVKLVQEMRAVYVRDAERMYTRAQVLDMLEELGVSDTDHVAELLGSE